MRISTSIALGVCAAISFWSSDSAAQASQQDKPQGYVRVDTNLHHNLVWLGGAYPVGDVDLEGDLVLEGSVLQADVGVAFYTGALSMMPSVGIAYNFDEKNMEKLIVPRLFTVVEGGPLYFESWLQLSLGDQFTSDANRRRLMDGKLNDFYTRDFLLFVAHEHLAIGPQVELRVALKNGPRDRVINLPVGGQISSRWGGSTFALFVGYETAGFSRGDTSGVVGRFTFVHAWR